RSDLSGLPLQFRRYLVVLAIFTLGNSSNMFLLLRAKALGMPDAEIPLIWALVSLVATIFSTPLSALSDRIGRARLIIAGWCMYALCYLALGINGKSLMLLWPLFAFYGLFLAATEGAERALVADMVPRDHAGTAYGWFNLVTGLTLLPASFLFGLLWQYVD